MVVNEYIVIEKINNDTLIILNKCIIRDKEMDR